MLEAISLEHTKGFKKALRQVELLSKVSLEGFGLDIEQDVVLGKMVAIKDIPEGTFTADGDPMEAGEETLMEEVTPTVTAAEENLDNPHI